MKWHEQSVCGKICCSECLHMRNDFYGFNVILRNNDSVYLEVRAIEHIIFSILKRVCVIFSN